MKKPLKLKLEKQKNNIINMSLDFEAKDEYFLRNGAFLLQKQITSSSSSPPQGKLSTVEPLKIFSSQEIKTATNNYDHNLIIARSIATIFRGSINDQTVAIKVAQGLEPTNAVLDFFLNQVTTKLQITHKNVVKLLGCCLETRVPILVYEFITNGTLFQHLHTHSGYSYISWSNRLKVAMEVAYTLCYMHCSTLKPIVHRDVKSLNIFLDESFTAKLTNFGLSVQINPGKDVTRLGVQGTDGYIDPEYMITGKVTEKCDVYGFGAVLVEMVSGKEPIRLIEENGMSLMELLASSLEGDGCGDGFLQIVDRRIVEVNVEEIRELGKLALRCVARRGVERPSMKEVVEELQRLRKKASMGV